MSLPHTPALQYGGIKQCCDHISVHPSVCLPVRAPSSTMVHFMLWLPQNTKNKLHVGR